MLPLFTTSQSWCLSRNGRPTAQFSVAGNIASRSAGPWLPCWISLRSTPQLSAETADATSPP